MQKLTAIPIKARLTPRCLPGLVLVLLGLANGGFVNAAPPPEAWQVALDQRLLQQAADAPAASLQALIHQGADVNVQDRFGVTPLMQAVIGDNAVAVRVLLAAGADANIRDVRGDTALDLARQLGHNAIERLLDTASAGHARFHSAQHSC